MGVFDKWKRNKQESNELSLEQAKPTTKSIIEQLGYPYHIF